MAALLSRPIRRLLLPVEMVILVVLATAFAITTITSALFAPFTSRRRVLRLAAFALSYTLVELASLTAAGFLWIRHAVPTRRRTPSVGWTDANKTLLAWALGQILRAGHRFLGFRVEIVDSSDRTPLSEEGAVLVLARHGGPGDSFALVHLLLTRYHRGVRIVLKDILQLDPLIDVLLNRLACCFLPSPSGDGEDMSTRLAQMAAKLGPHEALLIFPEGANWTPHRRVRAINRLRREHKSEAARSATLMTNVLPPRPGGILACLDARPGLPVVVVAHAGLDRVVSARQGWDQLPITTPMRVRAWSAAKVPPGEEARLAWLTLEWAVVDEWIDGFHTQAANESD